MQLKGIFCVLAFIIFGFCTYEPELMLTLTPDVINKQLSINYGQKITDAINQYKIQDIHGEQTVSGVKTKFNITNLKQHATINWKANLIKVIDLQTFNIHAKNVNLTLDGNLQLKIGLTRKQKGPLKILINQLQLNTNIKFVPTACSQGLGFGIAIADINVDISKISVKIQGKTFDNLIIAQVQRLIIPRLPGIITKAIDTKVNPLINSFVCNKIQQKLTVGRQNYILTVNSTQVPTFKNNLKYLGIPIDLTIQNLVTNQTNDELERDNIPLSQKISSGNDASVSLSSNFLNTIIWLVDDSKLLEITVTNKQLGPQPPILLNTTNLSILMPKLKEKWPNKEVFLMIKPASKYQHLLIRSGRIVTVLNLAVKFVVNITQNPSLDANQCIQSNDCVVACDLNMTLLLTLSLRLNKKSVSGLLHSVQFYSIEKIKSQIDINLISLKSIINEIIGSMIPDQNNQLSNGIVLPDKILSILQKFDISQIQSQTYLDFIALGLKFDL